jgi:hypothetical protein
MKKGALLSVGFSLFFLMLTAVLIFLYQQTPDVNSAVIKEELERLYDLGVDFSDFSFSPVSGLEVYNLNIENNSDTYSYSVFIPEVKGKISYWNLFQGEPFFTEFGLKKPEIYLSGPVVEKFFEASFFSIWPPVVSGGRLVQPQKQKFRLNNAVVYSRNQGEVYRLFALQEGSVRLSSADRIEINLGNLRFGASNLGGNVRLNISDRKLYLTNFYANYLPGSLLEDILPSRLVDILPVTSRYFSFRVNELDWSDKKSRFEGELSFSRSQNSDTESIFDNFRLAGQGRLKADPFEIEINAASTVFDNKILPGQLGFKIVMVDSEPVITGNYSASSVSVSDLETLVQTLKPDFWPELFLDGELEKAELDFSYRKNNPEISGEIIFDSFELESPGFDQKIKNEGLRLTMSDAGAMLDQTTLLVGGIPLEIEGKMTDQFEKVDFSLSTPSLKSRFLAGLLPYPYYFPPQWFPAGELKLDLRVNGSLSDPRISGNISSDNFTVSGYRFSSLGAEIRGEKGKIIVDPFRARVLDSSIGGTLVMSDSPGKYDLWSRVVSVQAADLPGFLNFLVLETGSFSSTVVQSARLGRAQTVRSRISVRGSDLLFSKNSPYMKYVEVMNQSFAAVAGSGGENDEKMLEFDIAGQFDHSQLIFSRRGRAIEIENLIFENDSVQLMIDGTINNRRLDLKLYLFPVFDRLLDTLPEAARKLVIRGLPPLKIGGTLETPRYNGSDYRQNLEDFFREQNIPPENFYRYWQQVM